MHEVPHSLPRERDAFVGRHAALLALARPIDGGAALVSVLGIGGTGKTRLVTRYGWTTLGDWPGGVWFCDLSEARDEDGIVSAVAKGLDVPLGKDDPVVQLGHTLASRGRCLVLLDNFEQVTRHAGETLGRWLDRATEACFVVTTREVLGLPGEVVLALAPLDADEAVDLFAARASHVRPGFALTPTDTPQARALVQLLDRLPLAIELAAAQVRSMSPETILARMSERFELLTAAGARHTRQATLRGALDWSWELLSPDERQALAQLSVFEGGFTLDGAEAVLELTDVWPVDAVQALVDKSLVRPLGDERFDLLVSVQLYASEKLGVLGGVDDAEARHGRHFAACGAEQALAAVVAHGGASTRRARVAELDNLVAAIRRAVVRSDVEVAVPALRAAWQVLEVQGPLRLAAELAEAVQALPLLPPRLSGHVRLVRASALRVLGRGAEARPHLDVALEDFRAVGDRRLEALALCALAAVDDAPERTHERRARYEEALTLSRAVGDRAGAGAVLRNLGTLHWEQGRMEEARACFMAALEDFRALGDRRMEGSCLSCLGNVDVDQGRMDAARLNFDAALAVHRESGDRRAEGVVLGNLGELHREQGRMDEACAHYDAALALHRQIGNRRMEGMVLTNIGSVHVQQGRYDEARAYYDAALEVQRDAGNRRSETVILANLGEMLLAQGRTEEARAHLEEALAGSVSVGHRMLQTTIRCSLGALFLRERRFADARTQLCAAVELGRSLASRALEGIALGQLGSVHLGEGQIDDAEVAFEAAVTALRAVHNPPELGKALCGRVRLWQAMGKRALAQQDLTEAEALGAAMQAGPESELGRLVAETRAALTTD